MLHQIKAKQFYTDSDPYQQCQVLQKIVEFKDFSRPLNDFPVLFKAELIFKDFSSKPSKVLFKPVQTLELCSVLIRSCPYPKKIRQGVLAMFF